MVGRYWSTCFHWINLLFSFFVIGEASYWNPNGLVSAESPLSCCTLFFFHDGNFFPTARTLRHRFLLFFFYSNPFRVISYRLWITAKVADAIYGHISKRFDLLWLHSCDFTISALDVVNSISLSVSFFQMNLIVEHLK